MKQTKLNYLLDRLVEELAESIQIIQKAKAFGMNEVWDDKLRNPDQLSNKERIQLEMNDVRGAVHLIQQECCVDFAIIDMDQIHRKIERVHKYMQYARERGMVE